MSESRFLAIRTVMLPKDTNYLGSIFGGRILSLLDLAAAQHAVSLFPRNFVTKIMREVDFIAPVYVGDAVNFYTETIKVGRTSITVKVDVEAQSRENFEEVRQVTSAEVIMVAVDDQNEPVSFKE